MPSYLIVGASRGLGYEWLLSLSKIPGNTIVGLARSINTVQAQLDADSISNVHLVAGDMTDMASLVEAAAEVSKITPSIDYLIVNGAYLSHQTARFNPTEFTSPERAAMFKEDTLAGIEVNVIGVVYAINAFLPLVRKGKEKKITVISTGMADTDLVVKFEVGGSVPYALSKAATNMVVGKYAIELKDEGITLLALSPGFIKTHDDPVSEEDLKAQMAMAQRFAVAYPHFRGPITAAESIAAQKKVIEELTHEQTGAFLSHKGNKEWL